MDLLPYDEFSSLHIRQFLPEDAFWEDEDGLEQSVLGFNGCRAYHMSREGMLLFLYPDSPPGALAAIDCQSGRGLPEGIARRILGACALPMRVGMSRDEAVGILGPPEYEEAGFLRYRMGGRWPYRIGCMFGGDEGLCRFWTVREDYWAGDDE